MLNDSVLEFNKRSTALAEEAQVKAQELSKSRYRKLARKHHPDKGGDTAKFQAINEMQEHGDICGLLDAERGIFVRKESKDLRMLENTMDFYVRTLKLKTE